MKTYQQQNPNPGGLGAAFHRVANNFISRATASKVTSKNQEVTPKIIAAGII